MSKKKPKGPKATRDADLPKFEGWKPLAAGIGGLKAKLDEDEKAKKEARESTLKKPTATPAARPAGRPERRSTESDRDDEMAFHRMMSGVLPLEGRGSRVPVTKTARVETKTTIDLRDRAKKEAEDVLEHLHHLVDDAVRFEVTDDGRRVEGRRIDTPPSLVRELRRGVLPIDARLDLHGLDREAALTNLLEFLRTQRNRGERCVLVIHGKGDHSRTPGGVLRGEISAWLSQGRAREHVAAFATARPDDGGEGAVYVALRR